MHSDVKVESLQNLKTVISNLVETLMNELSQQQEKGT